jgi:hypothetical protein
MPKRLPLLIALALAPAGLALPNALAQAAITQTVRTAPTGSVSPGRPFKMYVGQRLDGAHHFDGSIDEVRIYKRALTSTELNCIRTTNSTTVPNVVLDLPVG